MEHIQKVKLIEVEMENPTQGYLTLIEIMNDQITDINGRIERINTVIDELGPMVDTRSIDSLKDGIVVLNGMIAGFKEKYMQGGV